MNVQGEWIFQHADRQAVRENLFNPARLVRLMPDVHHVIKRAADHITCILRPQTSALAIPELLIDIHYEPVDEAGGTYPFQLTMRAGEETLFEGRGALHLSPIAAGTAVSYEFEGVLGGAFAQLGPLFIETQLRSGIRRFMARLEDLLAGRLPTTPPPVPPRHTAQEAMAIVGVLVAFFLGWLIWRWWRGR